MEPLSTVGAGLAVLGSKDLLTKLLGPTADYLGNEAKGLIEKCNLNLDNIFVKATNKSGDSINENLTVNPRILKHIMDEGRFCEDELSAEYYGGILASSRAESGRDDRGISLLATLKNLSVYQIRAHYIIYTIVHNLFKGQVHELGDVNVCRTLFVYIPFHVFSIAMEFGDKEKMDGINGHILFGLSKYDLISNNFTSGNVAHLKKQHPKVDDGGIVVCPSLHGAELFLWSLGIKGASGMELLNINVDEPPEGITIVNGYAAV